ANTCCVADKHVREPNGDSRRTDVDEVSQRKKIASQRQMPGSFAQHAFDLRDEHREDQIRGEKGSRAVRFVRGRLLKDCKERQQNKNRARKYYLPIKMVPVGLVGAHARGRSS